LTNLPLEERPNATSWDALLQRALPALDYVFGPQIDEGQTPPWTLGGGTALALRIAHRLSDDVDIFVTRTLKLFTPAHNPAAKKISARFQWPGHYLKYECKEGEIDFLSPHLQTDPGFTWEIYRGRTIALETLNEIIVKKIRYRGAQFTTRDIFDLAASGQIDPHLFKVLAQETYDALPRLRTAIVARHKVRPSIAADVRPTTKFTDLTNTAYQKAVKIVDAALDAGRPPQNPHKDSLSK
jgi:hypothetical protein